jgi:hypothetical protein
LKRFELQIFDNTDAGESVVTILRIDRLPHKGD